MKRDIFSCSKRYSSVAKKFREIMYDENHYELFPQIISKYSNDLIKGLKYSNSKDFYLITPDITSWIIKNQKDFNDEKLFYIFPSVNNSLETDYIFGVEIINDENAEIKILNILIKLLDSLKINFFIDISSVLIWKNLLKDEFSLKIIECIQKKNTNKLKNLIKDEKTKDNIISLLSKRGKVLNYEPFKEIKNKINDKRIIYDPSNFIYNDYYFDLIFEIYSSDGTIIGNGGNYIINGNKSCGFNLSFDNITKIIWSDLNEK